MDTTSCVTKNMYCPRFVYITGQERMTHLPMIMI